MKHKCKISTKLLMVIMALTLVIGFGFGGTLAWLLDSTEEVTNTFTDSDINITLTEKTGEEYKMVPGYTIDKDPVVTVEAESEDCWLFVEVEESDDLDDYISYAIADGWIAGTGLDDENPSTDENGVPVGVYFREVSSNSNENQEFYVLENNEVTVNSTVTKKMMDSMDGVDSNGETETDAAKAELAARPTLSFKAYAVQLWKTNKPADGATDAEISAAKFTVAEAWGHAQTLSDNTTP